MVGLPHVLMRFFTVPDARQARRSAVYATGYIVTFAILLWMVGLGAVVLLTGNPDVLNEQGGMAGSANMAIMHLAQIVGGNVLLGFMASVAFATLLAVVCGLVLAAAAALAHDLYGGILKRGRADDRTEVRASRISVVALGAIAVALGLSNAPFPYIYPGIFSIPVAGLAIVAVSLADRSPSARRGQERYDALLTPALLGKPGVGA